MILNEQERPNLILYTLFRNIPNKISSRTTIIINDNTLQHQSILVSRIVYSYYDAIMYILAQFKPKTWCTVSARTYTSVWVTIYSASILPKVSFIWVQAFHQMVSIWLEKVEKFANILLYSSESLQHKVMNALEKRWNCLSLGSKQLKSTKAGGRLLPLHKTVI